uniref:DUF1618 domain-containing protein n=1 Tax=Oryza glumipatula TaxID=40148 RepID=A0A0E0B5H5_9ORYZ
MPWVYHPQLESLAVPQQPESCPMAAAVTQPESPAMAGVDRLRLDGAMPPSYPSSWSVLPREVVVVDEIDDGEELRRWNILRCDRRAGYGVCEAVVEGVKLGARVVSDRGFSALRIIVSKAARAGTRGQVCAAVLAINNHVIVLSVAFPRGDLFHFLKCACSSFYLVYDASDASITMIPDLQFSFHHHKVSSAVTKEPLPIACGVAHYLVLLGRAMTIKGMDQHIEDPVIFGSSIAIVQHQLQSVVTRGFSANKMFSFDGLAMWVDLHQGILFCQHYDLFSNSNDSGSVPFYFVDLPPGCCNDGITTRPLSDSYPPEMYRSIVCVGDSIKFVTIEGYLRDSTAPIEDRMVTMWSLRPQESWSWRKDRDLSIGGICVQLYKKIPICATMLEPMPNMAPQSPILSTEDGSLHLLIVNDNSNEMLENQNIMVTVDMSKGYVISACLLPTDFGDQLPGLYGVMLPRILGSNFFRF